MLWMLRNQLGRRNLNSYQRVELVLKFEPLVKNAAEQRMMAGKAANDVPPPAPELVEKILWKCKKYKEASVTATGAFTMECIC